MTKQQQIDLDAQLRQSPLNLQADLNDLRAGFEEVMSQIPIGDNIKRARTSIGGVNAVELTIKGEDTPDVLLYFHGGVYVIGSANSSVPLVADLVQRTGTRAISVDYRLAPESPYPAAVEDAKAAYVGLLSQGVDPGRISVAGESAGGGLAIALLLALKSAGIPLPSSAFLMSPWADLTLSGNTITENRPPTRPLLKTVFAGE
jgi:acetyl esterase/lipase